VQRAIERRGIPTVSVTVARDITEHCLPPRAVFVPFMMGHLFGVPHHRSLQLAIIRDALATIAIASTSGEIRALPYTWAQARRDMRSEEER
jgi:hypothetical protein